MKLVFKDLGMTNSTFERDICEPLGIRSTLSGKDWEIELKQFSKLPDFFCDIHLLPVSAEENTVKKLFQTFNSYQDLSLSTKFFDTFRNDVIEISTYKDFGFNSWLYGAKAEFVLNPSIEEEKFNEIAARFVKTLRAREVILMKFNSYYYQSLATLIKFGYLTNHCESMDEVEKNIHNESFLGILPTHYDYANYLDPFIICAPYIIGIPLKRFTCGSVWIPDGSLLPQISINLGLSEILIDNPIIAVEQKPFELFGAKNGFSRLRSRRYVTFIIKALNKFLKRVHNPEFGVSSSGVNYEFLIQQLSAIQLIFSDFSTISFLTDPVARLQTCISLLDKLANFKIAYKEKILGVTFTSNAAEAKEFKNFFRIEQIDCHIKTIKHNLDQTDPDLSDSIIGSLKVERDNLLNFSREQNLGDIMRHLRNLKHGAFLSAEQFFILFKTRSVRLPQGIISLVYGYMLAMILDPVKFLSYEGDTD